MTRAVVLAFLLSTVSLDAGQLPPAQNPDDLSIATLIQGVETSVSTIDRDAWLALHLAERGCEPGLVVLRCHGAAGRDARGGPRARSDGARRCAARRRLSPRRRCVHRNRAARRASRRGGSTSGGRASRPSGSRGGSSIRKGCRRSTACIVWRCTADKQFAARDLVVVIGRLRAAACRPAMCSSPKPSKARRRSCCSATG